MKTREGYNKILYYMTAGAEVPVLGCGHTASLFLWKSSISTPGHL